MGKRSRSSPAHDLETDVEVFERLAAEAMSTGDADVLDRALDVYRGELLPFDPYEDWVFHHRQRLQLRHRELLRSAGRFDQLVALDPTDEHGHVGVMRNLLRAGDRTGVLRQFDVLAKILDEELGIGPSTEACAVRDLALEPGRRRPSAVPVVGPARRRPAAFSRSGDAAGPLLHHDRWSAPGVCVERERSTAS